VRVAATAEVAFRPARPTKYGVPEFFRRSTTVRSPLAALVAVAGLFALAGCNAKAEAEAAPPAPPVVEQPAASAGGACILWDYGFIQKQIGVRFTVAAADQVDDTSTCVVQTEKGDYPDLALAVVESSSADAKLFLETLAPKKSTALKGLGKAGYRLVSDAADGHGPSVEIGWLSEAAQLQTLKFTFAQGATTAAVTDMSNRLLTLAQAMDTTN
jgi:hypothetical protein